MAEFTVKKERCENCSHVHDWGWCVDPTCVCTQGSGPDPAYEHLRELRYKLSRCLKEIRKLHGNRAYPLKCDCVFCIGTTACNDCGGTGKPEGCNDPNAQCFACEGTGKVKW